VGAVEEIVLTHARAKARRIIQRTRAQMALEEQSEGLRSEAEMVEELAADIIREGRRISGNDAEAPRARRGDAPSQTRASATKN
jgi:hypothetical protein